MHTMSIVIGFLMAFGGWGCWIAEHQAHAKTMKLLKRKMDSLVELGNDYTVTLTQLFDARERADYLAHELKYYIEGDQDNVVTSV